jgi:hypothetical protein
MEKDKPKREGGTGFQPVHSFQITRRNLPHWQEPGRLFLTWRCKVPVSSLGGTPDAMEAAAFDGKNGLCIAWFLLILCMY